MNAHSHGLTQAWLLGLADRNLHACEAIIVFIVLTISTVLAWNAAGKHAVVPGDDVCTRHSL